MPPPTARVYYGWIIVALSFVTMFFVMGTFFSSGVLLAAMTAEYGWSRAAISLPFSIALIGYAGTAWLAGRLFDRYGPRHVFAAGALCLGVGLLTSAQARHPWHLCLNWGILVGQVMNFAGFAPHIALIALWFRRYRGIAVGIAIGGASLGGVLIVPGAQYLVDSYGWRLAYTLLGVVVLVGLVPLNLLWQRHHPADLGLYPDGAPAPSGPVSTVVTVAEGWTLRQAVGTARFWFLFAMVGVIGWLSNITSVHQIAHIVENGFAAQQAAAIVALMSLLRAAGSTVWGGLSDRLGREMVYTIGTLLCLVGLLCLVWLTPAASLWMLYGFALAYGFG